MKRLQIKGLHIEFYFRYGGYSELPLTYLERTYNLLENCVNNCEQHKEKKAEEVYSFSECKQNRRWHRIVI